MVPIEYRGRRVGGIELEHGRGATRTETNFGRSWQSISQATSPTLVSGWRRTRGGISVGPWRSSGGSVVVECKHLEQPCQNDLRITDA